MSHLSILPTVLRDAELLFRSLERLGFSPLRGGVMRGFAAEPQPVVVQVQLPDGESVGWQRQPDGSLALVGDLQRISRSRSLQKLITRVTRSYAAHAALGDAAGRFVPGTVTVAF